MNLAQRKHAAEEAAQPLPTGGGGFWIVAGSAMTFSGQVWPRGSVVPTSLVEQIEPDRLALMVANRLLRYRLGKPPANSPSPHPLPPPIDPNVERAKQEASLRRDGFAEWELRPGIPTPLGNAAHPSTMIKPSRWPVSQSGGVIDDK